MVKLPLMSLEIDPVILYKATVLVLSDRSVPDYVDCVLFHNRSYDDDANLPDLAAEIIRAGKAGFVAVTNNEGERFGSNVPFEANPGKTYYIRTLLLLGVPEDSIIVPQRLAFHAREENTAFIELAKQRGWESAIILAQPHQLLRSMLGAVQEMNQSGYMMKLFAAAPDFTNWQQIVRGSQGLEEKEREEHIQDELRRIVDYQKSGELATFDELFEYYRIRARGSLRLRRNLSL